ncbi:Ribosome-recycling factor [Picochlorum sp. SENEW3]|nr:Ribosome-recycling factor [Picochlorum sp. SENEW3]WPT15834.1 Ribosome-recycling factor [Picochlorum sp. SENEW3]
MQSTISHRSIFTCASSTCGMPRQARRTVCLGARLQSYTSTLCKTSGKMAYVPGKRGYVPWYLRRVWVATEYGTDEIIREQHACRCCVGYITSDGSSEQVMTTLRLLWRRKRYVCLHTSTLAVYSSNLHAHSRPMPCTAVQMEKMEKSLDSVKRNFGTQIANVTTPEASLLVIQPYDISAIPDIERAIQGSDLDLTPNNDGKVIRLQVPPLTAERRKEMTKVTSRMGEEGKVAVRNIRRDAMKSIEKLEKDGDIGEDGRKNLEDVVQKLTDDYVKQIDALMKAKSDELTKV